MNRSNVLSLAGLLGVGVLGGVMLSRAGLETQANAQQRASAPVKTWAPGGTRERWTADNTVFAFIDHQTGLMNLVENTSAVTY